MKPKIETALADWSLAPVVKALQDLRGLAMVAAATLVAKLGDIARFANPRQFMAYLGLSCPAYLRPFATLDREQKNIRACNLKRRT